MNYLVFIILMIFAPLWQQILLVLSGARNGRKIISEDRDENLSKMIRDKTGLKLNKIRIIKSDKKFGMMVGLVKPVMVLSSDLFNNFNKNELEYVVLHEAGHYQLKHSIKELFYWLLLLILGIVAISFIHYYGLLLTGILVLSFAILLTQVGRSHEYQSDRYALKRITNPVGMITATEKFAAQYGNPRLNLVRILFYRGVPYQNRMEIAEKEIERRKQ